MRHCSTRRIFEHTNFSYNNKRRNINSSFNINNNLHFLRLLLQLRKFTELSKKPKLKS